MFRLPSNELPHVAIEAAKLFLNDEKSLGVLHRRGDFQAITHDAGITQQSLHLAAIVGGNLCRMEAIESGSIVFTFLENGVPAKTCLSAFEHEKLEELA